MAEIQFSVTLWWILVVMSFHSPGITFCWNGDSAYTTAFILTGVFPILLPPGRRPAFLLPRRDGVLRSESDRLAHAAEMCVGALGGWMGGFWNLDRFGRRKDGPGFGTGQRWDWAGLDGRASFAGPDGLSFCLKLREGRNPIHLYLKKIIFIFH